MDYTTSFNITITWLLQQFSTFLVNPYIQLKTDAINMLTRWLATDRPVCTTTQTLLEAGVFGFPRRAKPSAAA